MADRERKRAELRKRKRRAAEQVQSRGERDDQAARRAAIAARTEAKNEAAREQLEPLRRGERPTVVTVAAVISALIALDVVGYLAGVKVTRIGSDGIEQGEHGAPILSVARRRRPDGDDGLGDVASPLLGRARLPGAARVRPRRCVARPRPGDHRGCRLPEPSLLIAGAAALFYFMIKAMARIQMPERRAPD